MGRLRGRIGTALGALVTVLVVGSTAAWAATFPVDVTVVETLPATSGHVVSGGVPGCASPTTTTPSVSVATHGTTTDVWGTKVVTCADGSTLELVFKLAVEGCEDVAHGSWHVTGATGGLAGADGWGDLTATYPSGSACDGEKVLDRYVGSLRLP